MRYLVLAAAVLAAAPSQAADVFPSGRWYAEGSENGLQDQLIIENRADGTFAKIVRDSTDCGAIQTWEESGTWTLDADRYTEVTRTVAGNTVDSASPEFNDMFVIKVIDSDHATMFDPKTGSTWPMQRVATDFTMPPPAQCAS